MSEAKRRGRPPQGPKSGKGSVLTTRITAETRQALEDEAQRTGRSISQVAEFWIEEARRGRAGYSDLLGGVQVAPAIEALVRHVQVVRDVVGDPAESATARRALLSGWRSMAGRALPFTPPSPLETEITAQTAHLRRACRQLAERLNLPWREISGELPSILNEPFGWDPWKDEGKVPLETILGWIVQYGDRLSEEHLGPLFMRLRVILQDPLTPATEAEDVRLALIHFLRLKSDLRVEREEADALGVSLASAPAEAPNAFERET